MNAVGRWIIIALFGLLATQAHGQNYAGPGQTFVCRSSDYQQNYCAADTRGGVTLTRQISRSACVQGHTWGYDRRGVWVTQGCEAEFVLGVPYVAQVIHRASSDYHQQYCPVDTRGGVQLAHQTSSSACIRGRTWGNDRGGVWVNNGCAGDFSVGGGPPPSGPGPGNVDGRVVRCESFDPRVVRCNVDTRGGVQLLTQLSSNLCEQRRSWGWDRDGIWVSGGCRADFRVGGSNP